MTECTFELAPSKAVIESKIKYNLQLLLSKFAARRSITSSRAVILNPDKTDPYKNLKESTISRFGESTTQERRHLLTGIEPRDRKPSELLIAFGRLNNMFFFFQTF